MLSPSLWDTVVMLRWPDVGRTRSVPLMSTTCLPSTSPRVSNVGPGPSDTNGTVAKDSNARNAKIGTRATIKVEIRLFTTPTLGLGGQFTHGVPRDTTSARPGEYR